MPRGGSTAVQPHRPNSTCEPVTARHCWNKVKRLLRDERTLSHVDRLRAHLTAAVSEPVLRDALIRLWYVNTQMQQAQGDACLRFRPLVVMEQVLWERLCPQWQSAYRRVDELLRHAVRASRRRSNASTVKFISLYGWYDVF